MIHKKRTFSLGTWAKKGEDIKNGDVVKILSSGIEEEGNYGTQTVFKIETRNGERKAGFNQTSINAFINEYGEEDANWVGKSANIIVVKVPGKDPFYYFAPDGYIIGDTGLEKEATKEDVPTAPEGLDEVPF
jgi:hypothetical protein